MMQNRIIEVDDILIVASNIEDLLEAVVKNPETKMEVTFRVKTGLTDNNINEELLKGKKSDRLESVIYSFIRRFCKAIVGEAIKASNSGIL